MSTELPQLDFELETLCDGIEHISSKKLNELYNFSRTLVNTNKLEVLFDSIVQYVVEIVQVSFCRIFTVTSERKFEFQAAYFAQGEERRKKIPDSSFAQRLYLKVVNQGNSVLIYKDQDSLGLDEGRTLRMHGCDHLFLTPLCVNSEVIGLLVMGEDDGGTMTFHEGKIRLAKLMADQSASAIYRTRLSDYMRLSQLETVMALAKAIETRDPTRGGHSDTMVEFAKKMAEKMGCSVAEVQTIGLAALLHDIGKIGMPDEILHKPGPLTEEQWQVMRRHPEIGADLVLSVCRLSEVASLIRSHHERYNGSGYPLGLKGSWISLGSRILSVADAYDAMTNERVYRPRRSHEEAIAEIKRCTGTYFDPIVVQAFLMLFD
jgi:putative nucleotidyltransferase with HDIG domain